MALGLNAPPGTVRYHTTPAFVSLPFLVVALVLWAIYFPRQWFCQILAFIALPFAMVQAWDWASIIRSHYYLPGVRAPFLERIVDPGLPVVALALTFLVLACVRRRWRKTQLGEVL